MRETTTIKKCEECEKEMQLPFWLIKHRRFCSKLCNGKRVRRETEEKYQVICKTCGVSFKKDHASKGLFCSHKCYSTSLKIRGEKPECLECGKKLTAHRCSYCVKCSAKLRTGKNHHNRKGGISNRDIHSLNNPRYRNWRMEVFARDNFKCRIADENCNGMLQAHHILRWSEYPELRYQPNNGIALCQAHHPRKRAEEKRLEPLFRELVSVSK